MPVCWITGCKFTPGRLHNGHEVKLHCFPNSFERIKEWLLQLGQDFHDIDYVVKQVLDSKLKKSNKFRFCSLHFTDDSFIINASGRTLRPNAVPTIFENVPHCTEKIHDTLSLRKIYKRKRKNEREPNEISFMEPSQKLSNETGFTEPSENPGDETSLATSENPVCLIPPDSIKLEEPDDFPSYTNSNEDSIESCDIIKTIVKTESYQDAETQTDFSFGNSTLPVQGSNFIMGNPAMAACAQPYRAQPYYAIQNPILVLNCFVQPPGSRS